MITGLKPFAIVATTLALAAAPAAAAVSRGTRAFGKPAVETAASSNKWEAAIIPAQYVSMGNSLPYGPDGTKFGDALSANGINNYWTVCGPKCTYDFAAYVFSNFTTTTDVTLKVVGPSGGTVYTYSWDHDTLDHGTNWFSMYATGNFSATGTYFVEVYGGSNLLGWVPMVFVPKS